MVFTRETLTDFFNRIDTTKKINSNNRCIYNLPMSFDIETTSFYQFKNGVVMSNDEYNKYEGKKNAEKRAIMYIWQFAINDDVIYGRTWEGFLYFLDCLKERLQLNKNYIVVYVHNLSYEFQFMCKWFKWVDIFADSERKPIKAETIDHIIFKCSYRLSGYSLAVIADNLKRHTIKKLVGDLDYNLLRNCKTVLSEKELQYCFNDVLIVTAYIQECIDDFGNIDKIPLTQTGKVRRYVRAKCFENKKYSFFIRKLTIEKSEYLLLKNAFMGGFTHANAMYTENVCNNVSSFDFTSSYPTVLISEKYPMSKGRPIFIKDVERLKTMAKKFSFVADFKFTNIKSSFIFENIISLSKCRDIKNYLVNNGRVVKADSLTITLTDIDFLNMYNFYEWEKVEIGLCYIYEKAYLPKEIIQTILQLYKDKTELKGVENKEIEYLHSKELLNSIYGMCVTSIVHDSVTFNNNEWQTLPNNADSELEKYNKDYNRFLFYQWGVWCTAYARNNLYGAILECRSDYIYSDTDSVKILNAEKHKKYFDSYNKDIIKKLSECLEYYSIDLSFIKPKTIKGVEKPLGVWDFEGTYNRFKTLGAKRYMTEKDEKLSITVCGLSKKSGKEFIEKHKEPFKFFNNGMYVDRDHTGKNTHTYIDNEIEGFLVDYQGNRAHYKEKSYIHLEKTDYLLSIAKMYIDYFLGVQKLYK